METYSSDNSTVVRTRIGFGNMTKIIKKMTETEADTEARAQVLGNSVHYGWDINPSLKQLNRIYDGLAKNLVKYGNAYCPCVIINPSKDNTSYICPCKSAKDDIEMKGNCRCRLFFQKKENK